MTLQPLPDVMLEPFVRMALLEDLGRAGDITTTSIIPATKKGEAIFVARKKGVIAGLDLVRLAFHAVDPAVKVTCCVEDGHAVKAGDVLAIVKGSMRSILMAERVALNYLSRLSGVATATHALVQAARPHKARICSTRKTTPGLRTLEKYAVRAGGGSNHRLGLDDAVLIKDNHIAVAGGVRPAILAAREVIGHMTKLEVEVDTLDQLQEILDLPVDAVLLDNMKPAQLTKAVKMVAGHFVTEASGNVTIDTVKAIAATGVDFISSGWITHSAPILDVGLDIA
ncbi:MAG: carboxylating nicotinate-nucleotide diphosphorylase [Alphaproteobacteria bacterium]|nr:carboxylating nicotinate-nucleotide diphosphorylase [Alphaproteobacteria bacterium]MBV8548939.1 carboxylating nicotinate-nucleotide diphosphorylase [Alphaproteobacteria bacterium]